MEDKYNYEGINYPASYEDIKVFEENNKIGVVVYAIDEKNCIIKEYHGNKEYLLNERIYLLRIEDKEKHILFILNIFIDYYIRILIHAVWVKLCARIVKK